MADSQNVPYVNKFEREGVELLERAAKGESVEVGPRQAAALLALIDNQQHQIGTLRNAKPLPGMRGTFND